MGTVNLPADIALFASAEALALGVESGVLGDSLETALALVSAHAGLELPVEGDAAIADQIRANAQAIERILPRLVTWKAIDRFELPKSLPLTAALHRQTFLYAGAGGGLQAAGSDSPTSSGGRSAQTLVEQIESHLSDPRAHFSYEDLEELLNKASHGDDEALRAVESLSGMVVVCLASDIFRGRQGEKIATARRLAVQLLAFGNRWGIAHIKKRALREGQVESALLEEALAKNRSGVEAVLQSFQEESAASRIVPSLDDFSMGFQNNFYLVFFDYETERRRWDAPAVGRFREQNPELWRSLLGLTEKFVEETRWRTPPIPHAAWKPLEEYRRLLYQAWKIIASYRDLINVYDSYLVTAMEGL